MNKWVSTVAMGLFIATRAAGQPIDGIRFEHKAWEIACDNTRTCRAAGYMEAAEQFAAPNQNVASMLLTRPGGPGASVTAEVQLAERERPPLPTTVTLRIDGVALDRVALVRSTRTGTLSPKQTSAIVAALRRLIAAIAFENGRQRWTISNEGANAVLLKMDAFQGRLDTVDALIRKGSKPASNVPAAIPMPVVKAARVPAGDAGVPVLPLQQQNALLTALRAALASNACDRLNDDPRMMHVSRLNANTLLASTTC